MLLEQVTLTSHRLTVSSWRWSHFCMNHMEVSSGNAYKVVGPLGLTQCWPELCSLGTFVFPLQLCCKKKEKKKNHLTNHHCVRSEKCLAHLLEICVCDDSSFFCHCFPVYMSKSFFQCLRIFFVLSVWPQHPPTHYKFSRLVPDTAINKLDHWR